MKVLKNLIVFSLVLLFISCNSDESTPIDTNAQENDLIGTWFLTEITQDGTASTNVQGVPAEANYTSFGKNIDAQIVFTQNPNNFSSSGGFTNVVTIKFLGQTVTREIPVAIPDLLNQGTWEVNQGVITVTQSNGTQTINITQLTDTTLKLEIEFEQVITEQGTTFNVQGIAKTTLTKQ